MSSYTRLYISLMIILVSITMYSCTEDMVPSPLFGTWKLTYNQDGVVEVPVVMSLKFNSDGTGCRKDGEKEDNFTWQIQRHEYIAFGYEGGDLKIHKYIINEKGELVVYSLDSDEIYDGFEKIDTGNKH